MGHSLDKSRVRPLKTVLLHLRKPKSESAFSNLIGTKLETNYKKKTGKFANTWSQNSMLLNKQWVRERNQERNKITVGKQKWKRGIMKLMGGSKNSSEQQVHRHKHLH